MLGIPKTLFTYQIKPRKKEGEDPGSDPGKALCSSVGECQDREVGRGGLGNREREEDLRDLRGGGIQERENHLKCK